MSRLVDDFPDTQLVLDASVLFNLLGSGRCLDLLSVFIRPCVVPDKTLIEVRRHPETKEELQGLFSALVAQGRLVTGGLSDDEYGLYLSLVSGPPRLALDSGESAAIAVAVRRGIGLVLDDGKARRLVRDSFPGLEMVSSLRFMMYAGSRLGWPSDLTASVVVAAHTHARMSTVKGEELLLQELGLRRRSESE